MTDETTRTYPSELPLVPLREAVIFCCIWAALFGGFLLLPEAFVWFVVPIVLLDIVLLMKVMGSDILIR